MKPEVLTLEEAAELLRVSTKTLAKDAKSGKVPATKIGREWRFSRATIMRRLNGDRAA
jgi:excisionase family DNA binding protein